MLKQLRKKIQLASVIGKIQFALVAMFSLALLMFVVSYRSFSTLQMAVSETVLTAGQIREVSLQVENEFLSARQSESRFIANWREIGFQSAHNMFVNNNRAHLELARTYLIQLEKLFQRAEIMPPAQIEGTLSLLDLYETAFLTAVQKTEERSQWGGQEAQLNDLLSQLENGTEHLANPEIYQLVLQIRANRQAYLGSVQQQYVDNIRLLTVELIDLLESSDPADLQIIDETGTPAAVVDAAQLQLLTERFSRGFNDLVTLEQQIQTEINLFRDTTQQINVLMLELRQMGMAAEAAGQTEMDRIMGRSRNLMLITFLLSIGVTVLGAYSINQQISRPVSDLNEAAEQIAQGNFQYELNISTGKEFITVGNSMMVMSAELSQLIDTLENRVQERTRTLEASLAISRHLSTILDADLLVSELVTEVQASFNYYHTGIYLCDTERNRLYLASEAGHMTENSQPASRFLKKGEGLVGQAAANNRLMLIPDVSKVTGWSSDPLLPETRAEMVVPIAIGAEVLGVLDIQHDRQGGLSRKDADLMQTLANQTAVALENIRQYSQARQQAELQRHIHEIGQNILKTADVERALKVTVRELGTVLDRPVSIELLPPGDQRSEPDET